MVDCTTPGPNDDALGLAYADLLERVAEAMRDVSRAYVAAIVDGIRQRGFTELTAASVALLARLTPNGSQTVELARQARKTKQATGRIVADLERYGYVERIPDPNDGRAQLVRATEKGREALAAGTAVRLAFAEQAMAKFGPEDLERLHISLASMEDLFGEKTT